LGLEKYISIGRIVRTGLELTNNVCQKARELSEKKTLQELYYLIEELNLECMIMAVKSILRTNETKGSSTDETEHEYVIIDEPIIDITSFLSKCPINNQEHTPKEIVLYYFYDSITKIDKILDIIKRKDTEYNKQFIKLWNADYTKEFKQLRRWILQLKERIQLYGVINK